MSYSLGLTLYNLSTRHETGKVPDRPPRPAGRLIWLHSAMADGRGALAELARRLLAEDGHGIVLTHDGEWQPPPGVIGQPAPADTAAGARAFLDHWKPDACILADGELRPAILAEALERGLPVALVNGRAPALPRDRAGWWPGLMRGLLAQVPDVLAVDEAAAKAFRKAGSPATAVRVTGRMEEGSAALPAVEADREALARSLGTRPVWFAASVAEAEETAVIEAHRAALRLSHRLLLIIAPQEPGRCAALARRMQDEIGWHTALRDEDAEPDSGTEVYLAEGTAEYGLWYRLAPITFLGGSLTGGGSARNPLEAAALGSALIHGPRPGAHGATLGRLGAALATRPVSGAADLAEALSDLLSPDRAARLAQAAWTVASDGTDVTDAVLALIRRMLGEDK